MSIGANMNLGVGVCMGMDLGIGVNRDATDIGYRPILSRYRF